MSEDFEITRSIEDAVKKLAETLTQEKVPDREDGYRGFFGLPSEYRRILVVLEHFEASIPDTRQEERDAKREEYLGEQPPPQAPNASLASSAASLPSASDPMAGAPKCISSEEVKDCPPHAELHMTAETPPQTSKIEEDAPSSESVAQKEAGQASVPPAITSPAPATGSEVKLALDGAQPRGVPAMPGQSPASENMAEKPIPTVKKTVYLKPAKVNEPYEGAIEVEGLKGLKLLQDDTDGSGLALEEDTGLLKGTPTAKGDFVIQLQGLLHGKRCEITANLAVIPDPKSLWISKDSDRDDPYWKPDEAFARTEGDLLCVAASKRGRSHANVGTFRDDDFGLLAHGPGGWHIAVVADGAGSAKYSRHGSKVAVNSVLGELPELLKDHVTPHLPKLVLAYLQGNPDAEMQIKSQLYRSLALAAFNAAKAIDKEADAKGEKASAFSTTLIVGVVQKVSEGWFIAAFSVGDGGAAVFDVGDGSLTPLTMPDSGEFAGQTRFLEKSEFSGGFDEVANRIFFDVRKEFTAVALMTDGISDPKFPTDSVFKDPAKWVEFWNHDLTKAVDFSRGNEEMERQFLEWLDFWSPGNHDDRTLAVLVP